MIADEPMRQRAAQLGTTIRVEDGVGQVIKIIQKISLDWIWDLPRPKRGRGLNIS